jgi:hypothetical protein
MERVIAIDIVPEHLKTAAAAGVIIVDFMPLTGEYLRLRNGFDDIRRTSGDAAISAGLFSGIYGPPILMQAPVLTAVHNG